MSKFSMKIATSVAIIGGIVASAVSASAALNLAPQSCSYMFSTNMKLGSRGTNVMDLQKVLNMYPQTQIAQSGAGSPGMETTTFGPATRAAVNKFQALHLVELGITAPTGNVFAGTRGLLNQVCTGSGSGMSTTLPTGCTSTAGFSPVTGASCSSGVVTNPGTGTVVSGPISAMLSGSQPTGMLVQGQSGARLADVTFTGNGTVTNVQLQRIGVSADATLVNVYLYDGNTRITDAASVITGGYINFNAPSGLFTVNGSRTITVRADILSTANGQSVGVKLNSVTAGGSVSTYTNIVGNQLQIANVVTSAVQFSTITPSPVSVDAGTTAYNVWDGTAAVSTRDVNFRAATFKFVGSAPVDAMANLSLFVDGTKVAGPSMINASNNNKVTFDLGNTPFLLKTGSHTIQVRGDIVKGSNRTISMSVENVSDLMFEDSNLTGVNVSATIGNGTTLLTQGNSVYNTITVNKGSVTVNVDPAFTANKVTGGATNVPVGQFTMKAYGEDVKVNTLKINFATASSTATSTLNNVSLYVNGGQVGTSQNFLGTTALSYNLGSSLVIPAGQTVTFTVKADIVNSSSAAYTTGSITTIIGGVSSNAQGQSSNELVSVAATSINGNALTISSGVGTFSRTAGFTAVTTAPNMSNVKIGSFTLQANSSEDMRVNSIGVNPNVIVLGVVTPSNISNLTVKDGSTVLGTPVGNPASGTSTFSFSDITIPANSTKTFDVYADIGSATSASTTADMSVSYRGAISNTTSVSAASGVAITSAASTLGASTLVSSSPVSQFVVGGSTFGVATFKLKTAQSGTSANVREMRFAITGLADAVTSVTVGGVTAPVVNATATVTGLNIAVSSTGTDVPVTIKYSGFQNSTTGGSLQAGGVSTTTLTYVEATAGSGTVISDGTAVAANGMTLVASKPTVSVSAGGSDSLNLGALSKLGEFTVTADANGKIAMASTSVSLSYVGVTSPELSAGSLVLKDSGTTITGVSVSNSSTTPVFSFTTAYEIAAGTSKTFSIFGTVTGAAQQGIVPRVNSSLTSGATFKWDDVIGGGTTYTGANIYNFPTNSYTSKAN